MQSIHTMEYYSLAIKRNKVLTHATAWMNLGNLPVTGDRPHNLGAHFHEMSRTGKSVETEHRWVAAYSWVGKEASWGRG